MHLLLSAINPEYLILYNLKKIKKSKTKFKMQQIQNVENRNSIHQYGINNRYIFLQYVHTYMYTSTKR